MTHIVGIPTTRVSDVFVRQRLLAQVQYDQRELLRLQIQLSTGRRFELPGEEPVSALRTMSLQRLLERKAQVQTNLATNDSYLSATDVALSGISGMVAEVRAVALGVIGTTATDDQRAAAVQQIGQAIQQLMDAGNQQFRGRYLFAGSTTDVRPFQPGEGKAIRYLGNEESILGYSDIDMLFATNVPGSEVFGAISEPVRSSVDLNPALTYDTRLADLRGGQGIDPGSIAVSDGTQTSIVDVSSAETIGDVAALIRASPPDTRSIDVEITAKGLVIQLDSAPGDLSIREVGGGTTAAELGILQETGVGNNPIVGAELDPILRPTTGLDDVLGTRATAVIRSAGSDNDLIIEADVRGQRDAQLNFLNEAIISFVDDATVGNEWVAYTPSDDPAVQPTIQIHIEENRTEARDVVNAVNDAHDLGVLPFTARLDPLDERNGGEGLVSAAASGETSGGGGFEFDQDSGLQIVNGNATCTIDLSTAETIEDLLNALNGAEAGLLAEINQEATGINLRSRLSGVDFAIGENGGDTATQLGLRTFTEETRLEELNFGLGVTDYQGDTLAGAEFVITRADGVTFGIDITGAETIGDVLDRINNHPDNLASGVPLVAQPAVVGNGIELVDDSVGPGTLTVTRNSASNAAIELGLIPEGQDTSTAANPGPPQILTGADVNPLETEGLFTALLRLQEGLEANDLGTIQRAVDMLDAHVLQMNFVRAELGARQQGLDVLQQRLDTEEVELREALSLEYDADLAEVISNLTARQAAFQAGLIATAQISQMTLLDYL